MKWRAEYIKAERAKTPNEPMRRIQLKIQVDKMTDLVEQSVKTFNEKQRGRNCPLGTLSRRPVSTPNTITPKINLVYA